MSTGDVDATGAGGGASTGGTGGGSGLPCSLAAAGATLAGLLELSELVSESCESSSSRPKSSSRLWPRSTTGESSSPESESSDESAMRIRTRLPEVVGGATLP